MLFVLGPECRAKKHEEATARESQQKARGRGGFCHYRCSEGQVLGRGKWNFSWGKRRDRWIDAVKASTDLARINDLSDRSFHSFC
jgi:hypothetical protein